MSARATMLISTGIALLVLGLGNWWVGSQKAREHYLVLREVGGNVGVTSHEDFPELSAEANRRLLQPFRVSIGRAAAVRQKLAFYRTVEAGGRLLVVAGCLLAGLGMLLRRREGWKVGAMHRSKHP